MEPKTQRGFPVVWLFAITAVAQVIVILGAVGERHQLKDEMQSLQAQVQLMRRELEALRPSSPSSAPTTQGR
jgi:hypothetical protein